MDLKTFVAKGISPFHVVENCVELLEAQGFQALSLQDAGPLVPGDYYIKYFDTSLFAFRWRGDINGGLQLAGAHTDIPTIKLKPNGLLKNHGYSKFNGEVYGGMVLHSWLDRPLAVAGKIFLKGANPFAPSTVLFDSQAPVAMIPGLAIHLNREINKGFQLDRQKQFLPVIMTDEGETMEDLLAKWASVPKEDILAYDANLYPVEPPITWGAKEEFLTGTGLDNKVSCKACVEGLIDSEITNGLAMIALFDNEEVGSRTKQGAASLALRSVLEWFCQRAQVQDFIGYLQRGNMLSMDAAHGLHPNYSELADPSNPVYLNKGVAIKLAANQAYATDGNTMAILRDLCTTNKINFQIFVNHNEHPGGSTIGSIGSTMLPMLTADVGVPLWSMHSARETMGVHDEDSLNKLATAWLRGNL